MSIITLRFTLC